MRKFILLLSSIYFVVGQHWQNDIGVALQNDVGDNRRNILSQGDPGNVLAYDISGTEIAKGSSVELKFDMDNTDSMSTLDSNDWDNTEQVLINLHLTENICQSNKCKYIAQLDGQGPKYESQLTGSESSVSFDITAVAQTFTQEEGLDKTFVISRKSGNGHIKIADLTADIFSQPRIDIHNPDLTDQSPDRQFVFVNVGGNQINACYYKIGDAALDQPLIYATHGIPYTCDEFAQTAQLLWDNYEISTICMDVEGTGPCSTPPKSINKPATSVFNYTWEAQSDLFLELSKVLSIDTHPHLIIKGHEVGNLMAAYATEQLGTAQAFLSSGLSHDLCPPRYVQSATNTPPNNYRSPAGGLCSDKSWFPLYGTACIFFAGVTLEDGFQAQPFTAIHYTFADGGFVDKSDLFDCCQTNGNAFPFCPFGSSGDGDVFLPGWSSNPFCALSFGLLGRDLALQQYEPYLQTQDRIDQFLGAYYDDGTTVNGAYDFTCDEGSGSANFPLPIFPASLPTGAADELGRGLYNALDTVLESNLPKLLLAQDADVFLPLNLAGNNQTLANERVEYVRSSGDYPNMDIVGAGMGNFGPVTVVPGDDPLGLVGTGPNGHAVENSNPYQSADEIAEWIANL